jgi:hypothetical protein
MILPALILLALSLPAIEPEPPLRVPPFRPDPASTGPGKMNKPRPENWKVTRTPRR